MLCGVNLPFGRIRYYSGFPRAIPYHWEGSHALLTRLPLRIATAFDLHVLGLPPAFVLSQDQTLKLKDLILVGLEESLQGSLRNGHLHTYDPRSRVAPITRIMVMA